MNLEVQPSPDSTPPVSNAAVAEASTNAYLFPLKSPGPSIEIRDLFVIGCDGACDLVISALDAQDRHCKIERRKNGYVMIDLRTIQGTFVNGTRIIEAHLNEGDEIQVGTGRWIFSLTNTTATNSSWTLKSRSALWSHQLSLLSNVAPTGFPILLLGPSGTGKEVIAEALHKNSPRSLGPLIKVNCSALTETLVESELFGHIKGSFTGAINDRKGAFEAARGGTLFLDEIGDLPITMQAKILRALENEEIRPVGADRSVKTDVRVIAATHQNLKSKIHEGDFRADLYFRLSVICVNLPALTDRMEDFDELIYSFAKKMRVRFSHTAIQKLKHHKWPGNIRELRNTVARAAAYFPKIQIEESHLDSILDPLAMESTGQSVHTMGNLPVIKEIEKQMIIKRLVANHGNQRKTAGDLGIPKSTLHDRLRSYNINVKELPMV